MLSVYRKAFCLLEFTTSPVLAVRCWQPAGSHPSPLSPCCQLKATDAGGRQGRSRRVLELLLPVFAFQVHSLRSLKEPAPNLPASACDRSRTTTGDSDKGVSLAHLQLSVPPVSGFPLNKPLGFKRNRMREVIHSLGGASCYTVSLNE